MAAIFKSCISKTGFFEAGIDAMIPAWDHADAIVAHIAAAAEGNAGASGAAAGQSALAAAWTVEPDGRLACHWDFGARLFWPSG